MTTSFTKTPGSFERSTAAFRRDDEDLRIPADGFGADNIGIRLAWS